MTSKSCFLTRCPVALLAAVVSCDEPPPKIEKYDDGRTPIFPVHLFVINHFLMLDGTTVDTTLVGVAVFPDHSASFVAAGTIDEYWVDPDFVRAYSCVHELGHVLGKLQHLCEHPEQHESPGYIPCIMTDLAWKGNSFRAYCSWFEESQEVSFIFCDSCVARIRDYKEWLRKQR